MKSKKARNKANARGRKIRVAYGSLCFCVWSSMPNKRPEIFSDRLDDAQVRSESFRPIGKYNKYSRMVREYLNV